MPNIRPPPLFAKLPELPPGVLHPPPPPPDELEEEEDEAEEAGLDGQAVNPGRYVCGDCLRSREKGLAELVAGPSPPPPPPAEDGAAVGGEGGGGGAVL